MRLSLPSLIIYMHLIGFLILLDSVVGQGGGQSAEFSHILPTAPLLIEDIVAPIETPINDYEVKIRLVAFGDWGDSRHMDFIDNINSFIHECSPAAVLLLGDNFYPTGIDPELGLADPKFELFTHHLANNLPPTIPFYAVLGNNDVLGKGGHYQVEFTNHNPNWFMLSDEFYFARISDDICVWAINSNAVSKSASVALDGKIESDLTQAPCRWKIFTAHFPMFTAGAYRKSPSVKMFRTFVLPLVAKYGIDFVVTGHDHTSQVIKVENLNTVFLVSGAAVERGVEILDRSTGEIPGGAKLVWGDDLRPNTICQLEFSRNVAQYKFLHINPIGEVEELFSGEKIWNQSVASPELLRIDSEGVIGPILIEPSKKYIP